MNKNKLKSYAPQARKDFIAAVTARANVLGLSETGIVPASRQGDVVLIEGREWPAKVGQQRERLVARVLRDGFENTMEAVAYTWFNRFAALRYMEIHDYLDHGYRVLSNLGGGLPEILQHATELDWPGLDRTRAIELKLAGNQDGELYRMLLVAQCNALSTAMPFLFERIDDETELLLPDNLLRTDSIISKLIEAVPEEDWQEVEVIGWLYQFYISEKKDQVIGKVVKSEDIPAATQLFTPNWIVQYLVQNSIGRLWLLANPSSALISQWPYYVSPIGQPPEATAQIKTLIQSRMENDGGSLNPETIKVLDPACGSGHILVEAYEVLKAIYLERGYQPRSIPRLILENNLFGLDIDDRAAQMAGFALLMKARADDRRLLNDPPKLNVLSLQESKGLDLNEISTHLQPFEISRSSIAKLLDIFAHAKTFGSLIQIPVGFDLELALMSKCLLQAAHSGDLYASAAAHDVLPLVRQALLLDMKFDAVVANPPYMGMRGMFPLLKKWAKDFYPDSKSDLFSMFVERGCLYASKSGFISMVAMQSWMFLSSFEAFRSKLLNSTTISSLAHFGPRAFSEISGEVVQTAAFSLLNHPIPEYVPSFLRLVKGDEEVKSRALAEKRMLFSSICQKQFLDIPGAPIAYWISERTRKTFSEQVPLAQIAKPRQGLATSDNERFLRLWFEVSLNRIGFSYKNRQEAKESGKRWFPCQKGGPARRWYGNHDWLVNWEDDGKELLEYASKLYGSPTRTIKNIGFYFREGITWSTISTAAFAMRYSPIGFISETKGAVCFLESHNDLLFLLALANTKIVDYFLAILSPTLDYHEGPVGRLPVIQIQGAKASSIAEKAITIARKDWDSSETSWDFLSLPWINVPLKSNTLSESWLAWRDCLKARISEMRSLEEENNQLFIEAYGLQNELSPEVTEDVIMLTRADREKDCQRLVSFAIGCMMGRYSLDEPGLIYAHAGNIGVDLTRYRTFQADADGIVPITDELWFEDDAANRIRDFLLAVWGAETLDENMKWLAESLGKKNSETPEEAIRSYLSDKFYKDHLQTYKKRPIYWLVSSGKHGAFQALVYLHRYHEGTLARMRSEYVVPLLAKLLNRIEMLEKDANVLTSAASRSKITKLVEALKKKHVELVAFEEKLRHVADERIRLDLDDGVKVNYAKFGGLLAEVKAVTGGSDE